MATHGSHEPSVFILIKVSKFQVSIAHQYLFVLTSSIMREKGFLLSSLQFVITKIRQIFVLYLPYVLSFVCVNSARHCYAKGTKENMEENLTVGS